jgi:hypothetical protein
MSPLDPLSSLFVALVLTEAIELIVAVLLGYGKREIQAILAINVLTNPVLNYLLLVNSAYALVSVNFGIMFVLESIIILAEWKLLEYALNRSGNSILRLSIAANVSSYFFGVIFLGWKGF